MSRYHVITAGDISFKFVVFKRFFLKNLPAKNLKNLINPKIVLKSGNPSYIILRVYHRSKIWGFGDKTRREIGLF